MIQRSSQATDFIPSMGTKTPTLATRRRPHDIATIIVSTSAPTPELLNAVGHAILRSIVAGQGEMLRSAAGALERLDKLLPNASSEARMIAALMAISSDHSSSPVVASPAPQSQSQPTPTRRRSKSAKPAKTSRQAKPAAPLMDINGKIHPSREIGGVAVVSQAEARKALGMTCVQMIKLENQKLLTRIQESGSRLVYYDVRQVQKLLDLIHRDADPKPDDDDDATDPVA